ncbi:hypothetical protein LCGC14_0437550 [marine sediment metagenome]|uniref:Uncharacterized protein n=1 Tax=marine sediment metagenome TaxID=412755 RepID=A0A0F9SSP2_9ZZZZ
MKEKNWIDNYIGIILNGPLPTIDEDTGEVIMVQKNKQSKWIKCKSK